ncbi:Hypothetical predicted protein, partial [Mytilus galloprovincialis]
FSVCHDAASRFVKLLTVHSPQGRDYVDEADLIPLVQKASKWRPNSKWRVKISKFDSIRMYTPSLCGRKLPNP